MKRIKGSDLKPLRIQVILANLLQIRNNGGKSQPFLSDYLTDKPLPLDKAIAWCQRRLNI